MKTMRRFATLAACTCAMTFAAQVHAKTNLVYTYDSAPLTWQSAILYGNDDDQFGSYVNPVVSFSFIAPESWLSLTTPTTFTIAAKSVQVDFDVPYFHYYVDPGSGGSVTIGAGGAVLGWDFDVGGHVGNWILDDPTLLIATSFGTGCNCDTFDYGLNITYSSHGGPAIVLGRAEAFYSGASNINGWQVAAISAVPEAPEYLMMAGGLGLFGWMSRRRKHRQPVLRQPALPALAA
jgi:hypothetical protein